MTVVTAPSMIGDGGREVALTDVPRTSHFAAAPARASTNNTTAAAADIDELDLHPKALTKWQRRYAWFSSDVLLYIVILNLASELVSNIRIDRFSNSLLVAVVLKLVLDAIQFLEHKVRHLCCDQWGRKMLGAFTMWLIIFSSKFLILWIDDVIFGSAVDLGYFWEILILSLLLVLASIGSRWLFHWLGRCDREPMPHNDGSSAASETTGNE